MSSWHWKSWWLSGEWIGVCAVSMYLKELENFGPCAVFGAGSAIRPGRLERAGALGLLLQLLAMDDEDAEGLDGGEVFYQCNQSISTVVIFTPLSGLPHLSNCFFNQKTTNQLCFVCRLFHLIKLSSQIISSSSAFAFWVPSSRLILSYLIFLVAATQELVLW